MEENLICSDCNRSQDDVSAEGGISWLVSRTDTNERKYVCWDCFNKLDAAVWIEKDLSMEWIVTQPDDLPIRPAYVWSSDTKKYMWECAKICVFDDDGAARDFIFKQAEELSKFLDSACCGSCGQPHFKNVCNHLNAASGRDTIPSPGDHSYWREIDRFWLEIEHNGKIWRWEMIQAVAMDYYSTEIDTRYRP